MSDLPHPLREPATHLVRVDVLCWLRHGGYHYPISYLVPPADLPRLMHDLVRALTRRSAWDRDTGNLLRRPLRRLPYDSGSALLAWPRTPRQVTLDVAYPVRHFNVAYGDGERRPATRRELEDPAWWDAFLTYHDLRGVL